MTYSLRVSQSVVNDGADRGPSRWDRPTYTHDSVLEMGLVLDDEAVEVGNHWR